MDKTEFFKKLSQDLAVKYGIPQHDIHLIRSFAVGFKFSREDVMDWLDTKLKKYRPAQVKPVWIPPLFTFLENLSDEAWNDITQKTKFDK